MSEEEKKAIEYLKARLYGNKGRKFIDVAQSDLRIFIKLVDRVLKDDKNWQEIYDEQEENIREKNNKICELEFIIENQQKELEHYKRLAEMNLKDSEEFKKNMCEHRCILNNQIMELTEELNNLKEIEKTHQEENGKLRVELEQEKEKNKTKVDIKDIEFSNFIKERYISKDKIKEIVDEHIPKQPNIITGEIEYTPNTNANSFLVEDILKLLEEK